MTFREKSIRISCQIIFVNKHWPQSCLCPFKSSFRKFYGPYGDLIQQYEISPSRMLNAIQTLHQLQSISLSTNLMTFIPSVTFSKFPVVSIEHLQRVRYANRDRSPFQTFGSVRPFGNLLVLHFLRPVLPKLPCLLSAFHNEYPSVLSDW